MRFLVCGLGSIGRRHLGNLLALGEDDVFGLDPDAAARAQVEREHGVPVVTTLAEAWPRRPHAVLVTTPTASHLPVAREAVERGCHVLVEKPLAHTWDGVEELVAAAEARGLVTLVGCNLRFEPGLARVKQLLDAGAIGRVVSAGIEFGSWLPDWRPWQDHRHGYAAARALGGGIVLDAIHELDYACWLLGEPVRVACLTAQVDALELETEAVAAILLAFEGGALAEVHLDYVQRTPSRTCRLIGEEGTLRWDFATGEVRLFADGAWTTFEREPAWQTNDMYLDELRHFLRCLAREEEPAQPLREGARVLELALAALAAAEEETVRTLPAAVRA